MRNWSLASQSYTFLNRTLKRVGKTYEAYEYIPSRLRRPSENDKEPLPEN